MAFVARINLTKRFCAFTRLSNAHIHNLFTNPQTHTHTHTGSGTSAERYKCNTFYLIFFFLPSSGALPLVSIFSPICAAKERLKNKSYHREKKKDWKRKEKKENFMKS